MAENKSEGNRKCYSPTFSILFFCFSLIFFKCAFIYHSCKVSLKNKSILVKNFNMNLLKIMEQLA